MRLRLWAVCRRNRINLHINNFTLPHLGDVPRDGGPDELGELVVADLTPLGIIADLLCVCHGTEDDDSYGKTHSRGQERREWRRRRSGLLATWLKRKYLQNNENTYRIFKYISLTQKYQLNI